MNYIRRWDVETMDERTSSEGKWVLHSDHEAEVARLRAEVEGLNRVKEIVAKTRRSNSKAYEQACQNEDGRMQAVCNARTSLLNNIDAAMGEGK